MKPYIFAASLASLALAGIYYRPLHGDVPASASAIASPAKPRRWDFAIPGWQPAQQSHWQHLSVGERVMSRRDDRQAIERAVYLPGRHGALKVGLLIRLGKGQHKPDGESFWPAVDFGFGLFANVQHGDVRYERGVSKGDIGTVVFVEEVR